MSGQPYKYAKDVNMYRQNYMDSLNLRTRLDDVNLQANKTYKATGQLPAVSSMPDNRTTSEKFADIEKMKLTLVAEMKPIADSNTALKIIQTIINDPLNADSKLFEFFAQRIKGNVKKIEMDYLYGLKGDADINKFVAGIKEQFASAKTLKDTTAKYFSATTGQSFEPENQIIVSGMVTPLQQLEEISKITSKHYSRNSPEYRDVYEIIKILKSINDNGAKISLSDLAQINTELSEFANSGVDSDIIPDKTLIDDVNRSIGEYAGTIALISTIISQIPQIYSSIGQLYDILVGNPEQLISAYIQEIMGLLPSLDEIKTIVRNYDYSLSLLTRIHAVEGDIKNASRVIIWYDGDTSAMYDAYDVFIELNKKINDAAVTTGQLIAWLNEQFKGAVNAGGGGGRQLEKNIDAIEMAKPVLKTKTDTGSIPQLVKEKIGALAGFLGTQQTRTYFLDDVHKDPKFEIPSRGNGLRRGRPRGRGITQPFIQRINHEAGIKASPQFIPLGKYVVNNKKLHDNIVTIKTIKGTNVIGYPSTKVSPLLTKVIKNIIGGGLPSYEDMSKLSEAEKQYLYKLSKKSDILDKVNIPAPSKDQQDKDNHNFEVMKGEIMSGNDNKDLVKKFKILILKLSKQGDLPKSQVAELLSDLAEMGY